MIAKYALAAAALLASSVWMPASAGVPPTTFDVSLDGHCDVFHLTYLGFSVWGKHSGCKYKAVDGGTIAVVDGSETSMLIANDMIPGAKKQAVQTWYFSPPTTPGARGTPLSQWFLYVSNGKRQVLKDQGTYTLIGPKADSSTPNAPAAGSKHQGL